MLCGVLIARDGHVTTHAMSKILINIVNPLVTFGAIAQMNFEQKYILLPVIVFCIGSSMCLLAYWLAQFIWKDNIANLIGLACVSGNTTYFALPIVALLLPTEWMGPYLLINVGMQIAESSIAYYVASRGNFTIQESIKKLLQLPPLWASLVGILWSISDLSLPPWLIKYWQHSLGVSIFIGMMMIGVALSKIKFKSMDFKMLGFLMGMRFIMWPLTCLSFVFADLAFFHLYGREIHLLIALIGVLPLPANSIAFAARLNLNISYIAICVLVSTIFALFYIPMMMRLFAHWGLM